MLIKHLPTIVHVTLNATFIGRYITPSEFSRYVHTGINGPRLDDSEEETFAKMGHEFEPGTHCITKKCGGRASYGLPWTGPKAGAKHDAYFETCVPKHGIDLFNEYAFWQTLGAGVAACNFAIAGRYGVVGPAAGEQNAAFYFAGLPYDKDIIHEYLDRNADAGDGYFSKKNCARYRGRNAVAAFAILRCWRNSVVPYRTLLCPSFANILPFLAVGRTPREDHVELIADYKTYMEYRGA